MILPLASHTRKGPERRAYKPQFRQKKKDHAAQRGRDAYGTATRMNASLSRRLSAFFGGAPDQGAKAAKFAVLIPGHAGFPNRVKRSEGSDTTPTQNATCFAVCALVCDPLSRAECVPTFARESECGPFVPEVLKTVWTMCWKRWCDCVSCAFAAFPRTKKKAG